MYDDMDYADILDYLTKLPKAELHLHLEGTVTPETLVTLSQRHDEKPLTLADAKALYRFKDFLHFLQIWTFVCDRLRTPDDYATITRNMLKSLAQQGVKHAEVYVAVGCILARPHLNIDDVFAAIEAERMLAQKEFGISALWVIDASRGEGVAHVKQVFDIAAKLRSKYPAVIGIGIGGDEAAGPCRLFGELYSEAQRRGLKLTAHCGEATGPTAGPREIRDALDMGVKRLGHAFCAQYDPELLDELRNSRAVLELNVTSNVCTGVCSSLQEHPIRKYFDYGLVCTINSDDPAMFGSNVLNEYVLVHKVFGFTLEEMKTFAANSFRGSFLSKAERDAFLNSTAAF